MHGEQMMMNPDHFLTTYNHGDNQRMMREEDPEIHYTFLAEG